MYGTQRSVRANRRQGAGQMIHQIVSTLFCINPVTTTEFSNAVPNCRSLQERTGTKRIRIDLILLVYTVCLIMLLIFVLILLDAQEVLPRYPLT